MKLFNTGDQVYRQWVSLNKPVKITVTFSQLKKLMNRETERRKYKTLQWWWPEGMREIILLKSNKIDGIFVGIICERDPFKKLCEVYLDKI